LVLLWVKEVVGGAAKPGRDTMVRTGT